jgi:hypothetical protein
MLPGCIVLVHYGKEHTEGEREVVHLMTDMIEVKGKEKGTKQQPWTRYRAL